jgi:hypothetical protein
VRVRQEPDVKHHVGVPRRAVLEPEADDVHLKVGVARGAQGVQDAVAQFVDVQVGGVDDHVGHAAEFGHQGAFRPDALQHASVTIGRRVTSARFLETSYQRVVACLEEQDGDVAVRGLQVPHRLLQLAEELASPDVDDQPQPVDGGAGGGRQFDDLLDEGRREVVDHEVLDVLQHLGHLGSACSGQPGDHHDPGLTVLGAELPLSVGGSVIVAS